MSSASATMDAGDSVASRKNVISDLPAAWPAMWRAMKRGYQAEPALISIAFGLSLLSALPDALIALWLKFIADGILDKDSSLVMIAAAGLAISAAATWFLRVISDRTQRRFRDRVTIALESHVARLQATVATVAHQERPEFLDRLSVLRDQVFVLDHMYMSLFSTCGWVLRLAVTIALLMSIHPALALLAVFAIPTVLTATWRPGIERAVEERGAPFNRLARHLFTTATTQAAGKEVRVTGIGDQLVHRRRDAWERYFRPIESARIGTALWNAVAWMIFGVGYIGAVVFVAGGLDASPGAVLLVLAAGARLSAYIGATVGEIGFLRGIWMDGSRRMAWLEDYAEAVNESTSASVPERLEQGIRFAGVSFAYPGSDRKVLDDVNLLLPAGSVVAVVGENGAGKSTLIKLLCRMYKPDTGSIWIDDVNLANVSAEAWRARLAGAFQDFFRFEFRAQHSVGVGDVAQLDDVPAVQLAVGRAGADDVVKGLLAGLDTQLGPTWPAGVDLSIGQWQKLALARGFMRDRPLVLVLDEPTAALDAETEHALFERYAASARTGAGERRVTILVSHRFSTVRMADLIVVMDGARVAEVGNHDDLMARRGQYAELYNLQANAYR
jgi:ATP-binding cassette, subfamily B, bacterial